MKDSGYGADEFACQRCGGVLPARQLAKELRCTHCGHMQELDASSLAALEGYRDEAARDLAGAAGHREDERARSAQTRLMRRGVPVLVVLMAPVMMVPSLGLMGAVFLHSFGVVDLNAVESETKTTVAAATMAFSVALGVGLALFVLLAGGRGAKGGTTTVTDSPGVPVAATVLCPRCGGPNELHVGVPTEECRFCHGTFAATESVRAAGLDASERARRAAALSRYQKERNVAAGYGSQGQAEDSFPLTGFLALMAGGGGFIACAGSGFGAVQNLTGAEENPWGGLIGAGAFGALLLVAAAGLGSLTARRSRIRRERVLDEARAYGGAPIRGLMATARWLGEHWAGPYELQLLHGGGEGYLGAEGQVAGFPWLVEVAPNAPTPRAQVLVGAFFVETPVVAAAPVDVGRLLADLAARGVAVQVDEAGARARIAPSAATPEYTSALRDQLVFLVARLGGRPLGLRAGEAVG